MGKKRSSAGAGGKSNGWDNVDGWKAVEVGEEFLLGSEEYGFMGPELLLGADAAAPAATAAAEKETALPPKKKAKTKNTKQKSDPKPVDENVDDLKARLAALEAENKALKKGKQTSDKKEKQQEPTTEKGKKKTDAAASNNKSNKSNTENKVTKKKDAPKKKKNKATKKRAALNQEESDAPGVDVSAWSDFQLDSRVMGALSKMGFSAPTHVQAECIPAAIRDRRDVIGAAQTGSGKTLAFGLPILDLLCQAQSTAPATIATDTDTGEAAEAAPSPLRALILAPTRELAMQVCDHLQAVGRHCGVWVVPIVGGISAQKQERLLNKKPQIIVATPGRLWDLMREGHSHVANLGGLQFLVIDEADRMVQQGYYTELTSILDAIPGARAAAAAGRGGKDDEEEYQDPDEIHAPESDDEEDLDEQGSEDEQEEDETKFLKKKESVQAGKKKGVAVGPKLQTFVFSATLTLPVDMRKRLRKGGGGASGSATLESLMDKVPFLGHGKPKIVDLTSERKVADKISEACIACPEAERDEYLYCLLVSHPGRTIVFVNAISAVRRLAAILKLLGLPVHALHAGMQQRARLKALDRFRNDNNAILVATDVAARGLDVKDVRCVVHYQLPASLDVYVHRSGRTARAEAEGIAIALVTPKEDARYRALLRALGRDEPPFFPLDASLMSGARERVRLCVKLDSLDRKLSKERADFSWRKQNAEEVGIVLSDDSEDELVQGRKMGKKARKNNKDPDGGGHLTGYREVEKVKAELNALLAEPLQPKFSKKFFTGGAAGGVALQQQEQLPGDAAAGGAGKNSNNKGGKESKNNNGKEGKYEADMTGTTSKAVSMAQHLSDSRAQAAAASASKNKNKAPAVSNKKKKQPSRAEALAAAIRKQAEKKAMKGNQKRGMFVVSHALGRNTKGPDALQALRARLGTSVPDNP